MEKGEVREGGGPSLSDLSKKYPGDGAKETPPGPRGPLLADKFNKPAETGEPAKPAEKGEPAKPAEKIEVPKAVEKEPVEAEVGPGLAKPPEPEPKTAVAAGVCAVDDLRPLQLAAGAATARFQPVALRNASPEVEGFDFESTTGDGLKIDANFNIADSSGKLVAFEALESRGRWVSILGVDKSRAKAKPGAAPVVTKTLRLVVIGGAPEVAVSGLEAVGVELDKISGKRTAVEVDWYRADENGQLKPAEHFSSLAKLVAGAASAAAGRSFDLLNESQLSKLFDDFESAVVGQSRGVNKVIWVKGAYSIPASMAPRFEKLILSLKKSKSLVRLSERNDAVNWLIVATARMTGFSLNYLKEPLWNHRAGELIEEANGGDGSRRRIIRDADYIKKLASALQAAPSVQRDPGASAADAAPVVEDGTPLVFDAKTVFAQRGYLFAPDTAAALSDHLQRLLELWDGDGAALKSEALKAFVTKASSPTANWLEILQVSGATAFPKLPRNLPAWMIKRPASSLTDAEAKNVKAFIQSYAEGAQKAKAKFDELERRPNCNLLFVPDEFLGLVKS